MPDGSFVQSKDYDSETSQLLSSITNASKNRWIVIPKTLNFSDGFYETESDLYDHHSFEGKREQRVHSSTFRRSESFLLG